MSKKKTIKVKFWIYNQNQGDGSACAKFFKSRKSAEKYASYDDERMCDDIDYEELEFDLNGNMVTPEPEVEDWVKEKHEENEKTLQLYYKQKKEEAKALRVPQSKKK